MQVFWHPDAVDDIKHIWDYIAQNNPNAATALCDAIREQTDMLTLFPAAGREGRVHNTRELIITGTAYIIAYTTNDTHITILAVQHSAKTWPHHFIH